VGGDIMDYAAAVSLLNGRHTVAVLEDLLEVNITTDC